MKGFSSKCESSMLYLGHDFGLFVATCCTQTLHDASKISQDASRTRGDPLITRFAEARSLREHVLCTYWRLGAPLLTHCSDFGATICGQPFRFTINYTICRLPPLYGQRFVNYILCRAKATPAYNFQRFEVEVRI